MKRVLGIEGGGTKTDWFYDEEGGVTRERTRKGVLPAANLRLISDQALEAILRILPKEATHVGLFLAGCAVQEDRERLTAIGQKVWPEATLVVGGDRESGFAAAFHGGNGVAVIAGTGSAITGRHREKIDKAGGWGHLLGDKGSGYDLGMQALRHVLWHYDLTREMTAPGEEILAALGLSRLEELVRWAAQAGKMDVARLAAVAFRGANAGDQAMRAIIATGAGALADGAVAVAQRLGLREPAIRLQGGLFAHNPEYIQLFQERIHALEASANVELCEASGAEGAAWLAVRGPLTLPDQNERPPQLALAENEVEGLEQAATEAPNPRSEQLSSLTTREIVDLFIKEEEYVIQALAAARAPLSEAIELTAAAMKQGGRLFYIGAGTSGRLGVLDASEIPPTFGTDPSLVQGIIAGGAKALHSAVEGAEDQAELGALDLQGRGFRAGDVLCAIAASGRTPYVLGALEAARKIGGSTILLTCNPARRKSNPGWDVEIDLATGPEILTGSTRLKAGTATKCALNLLSTAVMVRLGRVHGNRMSHVKASNMKLRDRAIRLLCQTKGLNRRDAEALLHKHQWNVAMALSDGVASMKKEIVE